MTFRSPAEIRIQSKKSGSSLAFAGNIEDRLQQSKAE